MEKSQFPSKYFGQKISSDIPSKEELDKKLAKFKKHLVSFVNNLPPRAKVLDAGCGKGKAVRIIMAYRPDIEIFPIDITDVKELLPDEIKPKFQVASVENVGEFFNDNYFDAIICQHVLEHLLYPMAMMENFKRVLKNDGRLFLETPNWTRAIFPFFSLYFWNDYTHVRIYTKTAMKKLFNDYDFEVNLLRTVSSSGVIVKSDSINKVQNIYQKENRSIFKFAKKAIKTLLIRAINPFLKDILIGIAINRKEHV